MNIDDRGTHAAADLAAKAADANMPPVPSRSLPRSRPAWAFAAGVLVVLTLVLVPLVLLGGPRDDDDPAVTTLPEPTVAPTTLPGTTVASPEPPPSTLPPATVVPTPVNTTRVIEDLVVELTNVIEPSTVASFGWGNGVGNLGLSEKSFGPCCFDVAHDGTVVVLDTAKQRLVATDSLIGPRTIAQWDPADFVPDAMVIAREPNDDVVFVLGMTNRPGRPHDLVTMTMDGTVIERAETIVDSNVELVNSAGSVWATKWRQDGVRWIQLGTEVGDIIDLSDQKVRRALLLSDGTTMELEFTPQATGVAIVHTDRQGATHRTEIDARGETWGHFVQPYGPDNFLVTASTGSIELDGRVGQLAAVVDRRGEVLDGFTWDGSLWAEVGPFGLIRPGSDGAVYSMRSTEAGVEIERRALGRAGAFDALKVRAAAGRAMVADQQTLWIAGPYRFDLEREWGEILQVDLRTSELVAAFEVSAPMNALAVGDGIVWAARAGDGGLPANTLARITNSSGSVEEIDLGDLSTRDLAVTADGVWILSWAGGDESAQIAYIGRSDSALTSVIPMPPGAEPNAMQIHDGVLWIASLDGMVLRYDPALEDFLDPFDVGIRAFDILVEDDRFESDVAVWVTGLDGGVVKLRGDGTVVVDEQINGRRLLVTTQGTQGAAWVVSSDGDVFYASEGESPVFLVRQSGVSEVNAVVFDGRLWLLGETLEVLMFGQ